MSAFCASAHSCSCIYPSLLHFTQITPGGAVHQFLSAAGLCIDLRVWGYSVVSSHVAYYLDAVFHACIICYTLVHSIPWSLYGGHLNACAMHVEHISGLFV